MILKKNITMLALLLFVLSVSGQAKTVSMTTSSKTSVSIDKSDKKYLYTSYSDPAQTAAAKAIIIRNLGTPNEDSKRITLWKQKGINASISGGKIHIEMYYDKADKAMISKVEKMADEISKSINR